MPNSPNKKENKLTKELICSINSDDLLQSIKASYLPLAKIIYKNGQQQKRNGIQVEFYFQYDVAKESE